LDRNRPRFTGLLLSKEDSMSKKQADFYFAKYIRLRDSENGYAKCCTCGRYVSQFDCGHFLSRRFECTRYDEKNSHAQCLKCNRFENGNQYQHAQFIDEKYGKGTAEALLQKSKMTCKRSEQHYKSIAQEFKNKIKQL
jgi:hypothetical protein